MEDNENCPECNARHDDDQRIENSTSDLFLPVHGNPLLPLSWDKQWELIVPRLPLLA
jgi:hypothetical protein